MKLYAVWVFNANPCNGRDEWAQTRDDEGYWQVYAYASKRKAQAFGGKFFGLDSYTQAKRLGWCEVREYTPRKELARVQF